MVKGSGKDHRSLAVQENLPIFSVFFCDFIHLRVHRLGKTAANNVGLFLKGFSWS